MSRGQLKLFSGSAHPALASEIAEFLGVSMGHARLHRFPDTEVYFQIEENIRGTDVFVVQPTSAPVDQHRVEMCVMMDAFRRSSASRITAAVAIIDWSTEHGGRVVLKREFDFLVSVDGEPVVMGTIVSVAGVRATLRTDVGEEVILDPAPSSMRVGQKVWVQGPRAIAVQSFGIIRE